MDLPLVDELAADIFMGEFSDKFRQATLQAADLLEGTLYQKYFAIDFAQLRMLPEKPRPTKRRWFARHQASGDPLCELCASRAGVRFGGWDPATNGMILEQQQILTTQNLATLFAAFDLADNLRDHLVNMAQRCFTWICARQQVKTDRWHARLIAMKNSAYAWRQMIFYLSLLPDEQIQRFISWSREQMTRQKPDFQSRFAPAVEGLALVAQGLPVEADPEARRFLGWSRERHWLM